MKLSSSVRPRVDLVLQVARQKAQPLARFDCGARQDDAVDRLGAESRDGFRHGKIGLAGTGGADADGDGVFLDGFQIILLADGLCLDRTALGRHADDILGHLADLILVAGVHKADEITHLLLVDLLALGRERKQRFDGAAALVGGFLVAGDLQLVVPVRDLYAEGLFDLPDILVKGAENVDQLLDALGVDGSFCHCIASFRFAGCMRAIISSHCSAACRQYPPFASVICSRLARIVPAIISRCACVWTNASRR